MFSFSEALIWLRLGKCLSRGLWKPNDVILFVHYPYAKEYTEEQLDSNVQFTPHFRKWNKTKKTIEIWEPNTQDLMGDDWFFYEEKSDK